ncbi:MAG: hypothetical protein E3J35_01330 [Methanomassiliicoccales archaeon]|nr:MAG: hypothetical protein E3J35_01330 [Methanomassiliicoccales archaeon]
MVEQRIESPREHQESHEPAFHHADRPPKEGQLLAIVIILVVSITVFLVAVFILVTSPRPTINEPPTSCFCGVQTTRNTTANASFQVFSWDSNPVDLKIILSSGSTSGTCTFHSNTDWTILKLESGTDVGTITYRDFQDNGKANAGDMLIISDLSPSTYYTLKMLWRDGSTLDTESFETSA